MDLKPYIIKHLTDHPSAQPQDVVKLCCQAAFGAEHLLSDPDAARRWLERELNEVEAADIPLREDISDQVCRVNLAAWKLRGLPADMLFELFAASAQINDDGEMYFAQALKEAQEAIEGGAAGFSAEEWLEYLDGYLSGGGGIVRHSAIYREREHPAYRIVKRHLLEESDIIDR